ncbi:MAG TPA: isoleucine--tRNA ligase [Candidatus Binatia bacterium]|nr:isoleucine--tRNA ligase [Candidatus Binatia bacterium]
MEYKETLNLPRTDFPMRANLPQREPETLARWAESRLYERLLEHRDGAPTFLLHDGPPYANGSIHIGHALNKVLKDIILKYRHLAGWRTPYRPGWDCHGLPIELEVEKKLGRERKATMAVPEVRRLCREYAERFVAIQRDEFMRLGILGEWQRPYLTMNFDYEATEARELARVIESGGLYRGRKPVHWCASCRTALAEAEVDYADHRSTSVYVAFPIPDPGGPLAGFRERNPAIAIWTTTPWTLPANLAIAVHPGHVYALVEAPGDRSLIVAEEMLDGPAGLRQRLGLGAVLARFSGRELEGQRARHPWIDRDSPVCLGDHVTLEAGTGCVHTAPGHGQEDYVLGQRYELEVYAPVDAGGRFTSEVPELSGRSVFDADAEVVRILEQRGALLASGPYDHSYPHCWRCKHPVIFRATDQWFLSMDANDLRMRTLREIDRTRWIPTWGRDRITGMIANRPDWCLSRQRAWGVPVIALRCKNCGQSGTGAALARHVAGIFDAEGADAWFSRPVEELVPKEYECPGCHSRSFERETDILDVWFDSGVSYAAVIESEYGAETITDLYLEGSDQHRGWFHSALLEAVATRDRAPYKAALTHGFVLDGDGRKMSKSLGNVVAPQKIVQQYGADILRLWVAAEDYRDDVRISDEIMRRLADSYRRIRNTARNLLANLYDFDPARDAVGYASLAELDRWALGRLAGLIKRCREAYEAYEFHVVYHALNNFCSVDMSALYFDIVKDRVYCSAAGSPERRGAQTAMHEVLSALARIVAPIMPFTADEIWRSMPGRGPDDCVFLSDFPVGWPEWADGELEQRWERVWRVRAEVTKALEERRKSGAIGHSLEAGVRITLAPAEAAALDEVGAAQLAAVYIVSNVELRSEDGISDPLVEVLPPPGAKCGRCWNWFPTVGAHADHPELCARCHSVVVGLS